MALTYESNLFLELELHSQYSSNIFLRQSGKKWNFGETRLKVSIVSVIVFSLILSMTNFAFAHLLPCILTSVELLSCCVW